LLSSLGQPHGLIVGWKTDMIRGFRGRRGAGL